MRDRTFNVICAAGLALVLGASHLLDPEDIHDAGLSDAQRQAQAEARKERAAAEICARYGGFNMSPSWSEDGALVCTSRKGKSTMRI